jgi:LAGLIDADG endonuclease
LSGKHNHLPHRLARDGREPAHIGETLPAKVAAGNPEGSPSDPLTTDPKGEACHASESPKIYVTRNTPALIERQGANGVAVPLDPWFVTGLTEGEGCFCVSIAIREKLRAGLEVRPSFSLSLNQKDLKLLEDLQAFFGCGWIRESKGDRTFKYEVRSIRDLSVVILPHFERFPLRGYKATSCAGFSHVCRMVVQGDHLQRDGLREIVGIAYQINLGKRRHSQARLLQVLDEVKG